MKVAVLMGSEKDASKMDAALHVLARLEVVHDVRVLSAHRSPDAVTAFANTAVEAGYGVIIAGAGKAAHLAGVIAAQTSLPVIGVPLAAGSLGGMDALLSTVQMPTGVPVATVAVDGAANAAVLAAQILALSDTALADRLAAYKKELAG